MPATVVTSALTPATVTRSELDTENKRAAVYLEADQVSLAIGKGGINIKLASSLTGYEIDVFRNTDTTEFDVAIFDKLNLNYSKDIWNLCVKFDIPLVYASSAATYGMGEHGYEDNHDIVNSLKPLNPYGDSKNDFDKWALKQEKQPYFWAGLKFFNVYVRNAILQPDVPLFRILENKYK